jgi:hypothetical protein
MVIHEHGHNAVVMIDVQGYEVITHFAVHNTDVKILVIPIAPPMLNFIRCTATGLVFFPTSLWVIGPYKRFRVGHFIARLARDAA